MAVDDARTTQKVKEAAYFFKNKWRESSYDQPIRIEDGEMIQAAAYAASFFLENKEGCISETSQKILGMCRSYALGQREFAQPDLWNAGLLCDNLVAEVKSLEEGSRAHVSKGKVPPAIR